MDTSRNIKTKAIVLSSSIYKESNKVLELITERYGRIRVFARGALNPKKELLEVTSIFAESEFLITNINGHYYVKEANCIATNFGLSKNIQGFLVAKYVAELLSKTLPLNSKDKNVYELTKVLLSSLCESPELHKYYKVGYSLKYLSFIGFRPNLDSCIECGIKDYDNMYFTNDGGLICSSCINSEMELYKLSRNEIETLNKLLYSKFSEFKFINKPSSVIIDRLDNLIYDYILYCGELFEIKAQDMYDRLSKN